MLHAAELRLSVGSAAVATAEQTRISRLVSFMATDGDCCGIQPCAHANPFHISGMAYFTFLSTTAWKAMCPGAIQAVGTTAACNLS